MEKDKNIEEAKKSILDNADEYFDLTQTNNNFGQNGISKYSCI